MGTQLTRMSDNEDYSVDAAGDAGAADTKPMEAGQVRKGGFIMIKGKPCKVVDVSTSKTGKHGHAKCHFVATNIFTNKKQEELCPATHNIDVPFVTRKDYQVMDIGDEADGGYLSLMDEEGNTREDLVLPSMGMALTKTTRSVLKCLRITSRRVTAMCTRPSSGPARQRRLKPPRSNRPNLARDRSQKCYKTLFVSRVSNEKTSQPASVMQLCVILFVGCV